MSILSTQSNNVELIIIAGASPTLVKNSRAENSLIPKSLKKLKRGMADFKSSIKEIPVKKSRIPICTCKACKIRKYCIKIITYLQKDRRKIKNLSLVL